ncbi:hypothetical protein [Nocardia sputi]|uniref:hypothetical protein n=1 Tax=Nocardia sputi TaxID=2943705 RepID=UPI0020BF837F|nr:hypothetical protein [Nocardia sputi]
MPSISMAARLGTNTAGLPNAAPGAMDTVRSSRSAIGATSAVIAADRLAHPPVTGTDAGADTAVAVGAAVAGGVVAGGVEITWPVMARGAFRV